MNHRVIARLDIKGSNLVKGIHLEGLRVLGSPMDFAQYYYEQGADEIIYMDVVASLYGRNSLQDIISMTAKKTFIPITVGGGIRSIEDIRNILKCGADKVVMNTAAIKNPDLIREASKKFGSSTIVVAIEAIKQPDGKFLAFTDNGREHTGVDVIEWAKKAQELGAGEILITSVDREGTGTGFENSLISQLSTLLSIPIIAHGGAGNLSHIVSCFLEGKADAVALASIIHYDAYTKFLTKFKLSHEGNLHFMKNNNIPLYIKPAQISEIKLFLARHSIDCRPFMAEFV